MKRDFFSNHIGTSSELTMIADIKPGVIPIRETMTYSSRLRNHLRMLSALRRYGLETDRGGLYVGPIDALRTLQFVKWTLIDNDRKMLLAVNFDRPLEPYIRRIVDIAGPLLDTILCHCEGFDGHYSDLGYHKFAQFPAINQQEVELFAAAAPNFTVDDADYFTEMDAEWRRKKVREFEPGKPPQYDPISSDEFDKRSVGVRLSTPEDKIRRSRNDHPGAVLHQALNIIRTMHGSKKNFPEFDDKGIESRDDFMYFRLATSLVPGFWEGLRERFKDLIGIDPPASNEDFWDMIKGFLDNRDAMMGRLPDSALKNPFLPILIDLLSEFSEPLDWFSKPPRPRDRMPLLKPLPPEGEIQAPILTKPKDITHGCLAFVQVNDPAKAAKFLRSMTNRLFPNGKGQPDVYWTLSITYKGMKSLEIPEETRLAFPAPFREGMAARAGMLGDTDGNHPREWKWPTDFSGRDIDPSNIDIIVQMLTSAPDHPDVPVFSQNDPTLKDHPLHQAFCDLKADCEATGLSLLGLEPMQRRTDENGLAIGHLGFADGVSQPSFSGKDDYKAEPVEPDGEDTYASTIRGDILLGRENSLDKELDPGLHKGERSRFERLELPFLDGTFQVIRKMALDVEAFNNVDRQVDSNACPVPKAERIQEMIFGRKKDGTPLIPVSDPLSNDFNYRNDPEGKLCPLQSHVRRTNPRIKGTPRLLRRGFSFGTFDHSVDVDRGLMFIAYNANIAEQFEQIQSWVAGANITGIPSFHSDPLLAPIRPDSNRVFRFEEKGEVVRVELADKPIATLRWGLYAFVPSREGLLKLASMAGSAETSMSDLACFGRRVKEMRIDSVPADQREDAWKILLEDRDHVRRDEREAIWAWIRERHNGVYDTGTENYGVLVGSEKGVRDVYKKSEKEISVRDYWFRMNESIGPQKLGYDPKPKKMTEPDEFYDNVKPGDHAEEVKILSTFVAGYSLEDIFKDAYEHTRKYLDELPVERQPMRRPTIGRPPENTGDAEIKTVGKRIHLERMIDDVAAQLSAKWFGLPSDPDNPYLIIGGPKDEEDKRPHCPQDILNASFYVFGPAPTKTVRDLARNEFTTAVSPNLSKYFETVDNPPPYTLIAALKKAQDENPEYWNNKKVGEALAGVTFGFVGPVPGSFLTTMYDWIDDDMLRRVQQVYLANVDKPERSSAAKVLEPFLLAGMRGSPIPDLLYRRSVDNVNIGGVDIEENRRITISNRSAVVDDPTAVDLLFGGDYWAKGKDKLLHACPGQHMGLNAIYGVLSALFEKGRLRAEGPLLLRLDLEETSENTVA